MLEDQKKTQRRNERNGVLGGIAMLHFKVAERESLDDQGGEYRDGDADDKRNDPGPAAGEFDKAVARQSPRHHSGEHKSVGIVKFRKLRTPMVNVNATATVM